jgi:hypothetical protein
MYLTKELNHSTVLSSKVLTDFYLGRLQSRIRIGRPWITDPNLDPAKGSRTDRIPTTLVGSVFFSLCVSDQDVQKEIAWLPVGEILEDRNAGSVFFLCVSDQGVQEEIACLPVG